MDFITDLIVEHIKEIGEDKVFVVYMDGVSKGDFVDPLEEEKQARSGPCPVSRAYTHQPLP